MAYGGGPGFCLTGARFNMSATLLHQNEGVQYDDLSTPGGTIDIDDYGVWEDSQDPLTGDIIKVWKPYAPGEGPVVPDPAEPGGVNYIGNIPCVARGIVDGGIRVAGTTERFGDTYENIDYVKMWVPANVLITKRDRIINIRDPKGRIIWVDEEFSDPFNLQPPRATEFNVNGVTPLFNAFNTHTENFVLLERAEVRSQT
jgi:hypothetical protein